MHRRVPRERRVAEVPVVRHGHVHELVGPRVGRVLGGLVGGRAVNRVGIGPDRCDCGLPGKRRVARAVAPEEPAVSNVSQRNAALLGEVGVSVGEAARLPVGVVASDDPPQVAVERDKVSKGIEAPVRALVVPYPEDEWGARRSLKVGLVRSGEEGVLKLSRGAAPPEPVKRRGGDEPNRIPLGVVGRPVVFGNEAGGRNRREERNPRPRLGRERTV